jgi:glutamate synthase domain-containing protein 1
MDELEAARLSEEDYVVDAVMTVNSAIEGAFVTSSAKNMGAFKGVGFAEDIGDFFRLDEYEGYVWTGHARFPTNTPGWWGGAHPFTLLDWSIIHNGEISSYGINKRYLEMFGYKCTLLTDTEVVAYLLDLLVRRHGLSVSMACKALAPPFWKDVDEMPEDEREAMRALRTVYASAALNGPFALLFAYSGGLVGFNDRIKLRPLVAGKRGDTYYMASEECAMRQIAPDLEAVWSPVAGEPVIVELGKGLVIEDEFEPAAERVSG